MSSPINNENWDVDIEADEEDLSVAGMRLDTYMEECVRYNESLEISKPDHTLAVTPNVGPAACTDRSNVSSRFSQISSSGDTCGQSLIQVHNKSMENFLHPQILDSFHLENSASSAATTNFNNIKTMVQTSTISPILNRSGTSKRLEDSIYLLKNEANASIHSHKTVPGQAKIEPFLVDDLAHNAKPNLLARINEFLQKELSQIEGKRFRRMSQQNRHHTPQSTGGAEQEFKDGGKAIKNAEIPLLSASPKLLAYKQAFHIYLSDSRQRKYASFLTSVQKEYNDALEKAEIYIQAVPDLFSKLGSASQAMDVEIAKIVEEKDTEILSLKQKLRAQQVQARLNIEKREAEAMSLRQQLEACEANTIALSVQRKNLMKTQVTLLAFFEKYAKWRQEGRAAPIYGDEVTKLSSPTDKLPTAQSNDDDGVIPTRDILAKQEWKGVHNALTSLSEDHAQNQSDVEMLTMLHRKQLEKAHNKINNLLKRLEVNANKTVPQTGQREQKKSGTSKDSIPKSKKLNKAPPMTRKAPPIELKALPQKVSPATIKGQPILEKLRSLMSSRPLPFEVIRINEEKLKGEKQEKLERTLKGVSSPTPVKKDHLRKPLSVSTLYTKPKIENASPLSRRLLRKIKR